MNPPRANLLNLSIVLPCYNPRAGWQVLVAQQYQEIRKSLPHTQVELIVVDDGSTIPVTSSAKKFLQRKCPNFRFLTYRHNRGKGYAVRYGVSMAQAPFIIYTDIDFPYSTTDFCQVYYSLRNGEAELVMAKREHAYSGRLSPIRRIASNACNYLNQSLLNLLHRDVQSGLKGMNFQGRQLLLDTTINRFLFDTELVWLAGTHGNIRIKSVPVTLREGIVFTNMSSSVYFNEAGNFMRLLLKDKLFMLRRFDAKPKAAIPRIA